MKVVPYTFINVESFLGYQKQHMYILDQKEAKANLTKLEVIHNDTEDTISAISPKSINAKEKTTRKKHIKLRNGLKKRMDAIITKDFTLYQQMSDAALHAERDDIVAEHCFTTG